MIELRVILKGNFFNGDSWDLTYCFGQNGHPILGFLGSCRVAFKTGFSQIKLSFSGTIRFSLFSSVKWLVSLGFKHLLCTYLCCQLCDLREHHEFHESLCFDLVFGVSLSSSDSRVCVVYRWHFQSPYQCSSAFQFN